MSYLKLKGGSSCRLPEMGTSAYDKFLALKPSKPVTEVDEAAAKRVLNVLSYGLPRGLGSPAPGKMCVEAAVSFSMGYNHTDQPECVLDEVASYKINLNDADWTSNMARARGLKAVAIAQLGSNKLNSDDWDREVLRAFLRRLYPIAARLSGSGKPRTKAQLVRLARVEEAIAELSKAASDDSYIGDNQGTLHETVDNVLYNTVVYRLLGLRGKNAALRFQADIAVEALTVLECKGTKYLYLLDKKAKSKKRSNKKGKK